jgi:purine-nucleoside phosphorylase
MKFAQSWTVLAHAAQDRPPDYAVVLGSGLGDIAAHLRVRQAVEFAALPNWPAASVDGHRGHVLLGDWAGRSILLFDGRLHFYEGLPWHDVLAPIHLAASLGVRALILTNAAGGIRADLAPGTLMAITEHLDLTERVAGSVPARSPYSAKLVSLLAAAAGQLGVQLAQGRYAAVLGPNYETPAEIRALQALGADAVGMSTAREMEAAHRLGLECAAISCITNRAAGLSGSRLTHAEVLANAQKQAKRLGTLLERFLAGQHGPHQTPPRRAVANKSGAKEFSH